MKRTCLTAMAVVTVSCFGPFDPCTETRYVFAVTGVDFTDTGLVEGSVSWTEHRHDAKHQFTWIVFFAPTDNADSLFTAAHLHEAETDDVLYTFPVSMERAEPQNPARFAWIVSSFETDRYQGSVPIDRLYELVSSNGTYIDVHTVAHPVGTKARLVVNTSTNWTQDCDSD